MPSHRSALPVSAIHVARLLPNVTMPFVSITSAAVVDVAKVEGDEVAR